ncbi:MAG TPA: NADP-dependent oxidoreductase [Anaerolineales bacterium]|nr:NADP-dependent oxidoreductase [Anaerolineales bacterium]
MKAVRIHDYGGPDVLSYEDAPRPTARPGELLIRVHATTVNPFDCAVRSGYLHSYFNYNFPLIIGTDVSGVVEEVGEGVAGFSPGDSVYSRTGVFRDGANAEYAVAFAADVAMKPQSLDHIHAAAIPHVTLTAWQALFEIADLSEGQTVLIHAAAGGVGHIATQLAKTRGAKVIGTASVHLDFLDELGVDQSIDYAATAFEDIVSNADVVLDLLGGETQQRSWKVLKPGGILISTVQPPSEETALAHSVRQRFIDAAPPIGKTLTEVATMVDNGQIKPVVSTILPLKEIQKAHQMVEGRHMKGKLVLQVQD